jgi:hypothetical protein
MPGIFVSYRRDDTIAWAGRLFADLSRCFGKSQVFMDINGGIPRGSDFEQVLTSALSGCDALLALIGPEWVDCKRDGRRRLDFPDDWVRNEVATALHRNITVMPVLFGDVQLPKEAELPEDLRLLLKRQKAEVSDTRWDYDVLELIRDLVKLTSLKPLEEHDVASANTGLLLLKDLMTKAAVADAVSRSKEVIENTYRQVGKLELFKTVHDALHTIEFECLRPMQAGVSGTPLRRYKVKFATAHNRIQEATQRHDMNPALREEILDRLADAAAAFQEAVDTPGDAAYGRVVGELNLLLSALPARLDSGIADAAAELRLDRLVELMTTVGGTFSAAVSEGDPGLAPFVQGVDALQRLRDELAMRVTEHTRLQNLDFKLRTLCVGGTTPEEVTIAWRRIKQARSRLAPPFSSDLESANCDLVAIESDVEGAVGRGDKEAALEFLREYFICVGSAFRAVDTSLSDFCMRLSNVSQPLKTILQMC